MIRGSWHTKSVFIITSVGITRLDPRPSQTIINHSPDGFLWGYNGSGPAQFSLALLLFFTEDKDFSLKNYQEFKRQIIANIPQMDFEIDISIIKVWIANHGFDPFNFKV